MRIDSVDITSSKETERKGTASDRAQTAENLRRALEKTQDAVAEERENIMTRHHETVRKGQEANRKRRLETERKKRRFEDARARTERFEEQREVAAREKESLVSGRKAAAERSRGIALDAERRNLPGGEERESSASLRQERDEVERSRVELDAERIAWIACAGNSGSGEMQKRKRRRGCPRRLFPFLFLTAHAKRQFYLISGMAIPFSL